MKSLRTLRALWVCSLLLCASQVAAEGRCPPGTFPVGPTHVMQCAPIPTAHAADVEDEGPRWVSQWGAIARDASGTGINGVSGKQHSKRAASREALDFCRRHGGKACKVEATYSNSCIVVATPYADGAMAGGIPVWQIGPDVEAISRSASERCELENQQTCAVAYSQCSWPYLAGSR